MHGHCRGLRHLRAVRAAIAGSGGNLQRLPGGGANRHRAGVYLPGLLCLGAVPWREAHPNPARTAHAERLHRVLQWQVPRRVLERALGRDVAAGALGNRPLAPGLQLSDAAH